MIYTDFVKNLNPHIEEEVTVEIEGIEFTGFAFICSYKIELGKSYPVSIGFTILDDLIILEIQEETKEIEGIGSGYEYYIRGLLYEDTLDAGIVFNDEDQYFFDYPELIGKNVEMRVDRISIEFLKIPVDNN
ncbi:hypothetical protein [Gracilibacillus lacisalsi]|uniref:hypothetical protein n=1 Tax=Gracilibacillus lacisalsi TaxID=393087 RepID=UPI00036B20FA|nr:hypothetical protein [Gracilibacillus lacisalsi]